ncbi:MAG: hypothetical protein JSW71_08265, partial [Gemmatimonadota bacterium]
DEEAQSPVRDVAFGEESDANTLAEQELEDRVAEIQDFWRRLKQVAGRAEVNRTRLLIAAPEFAPQSLERVLIKNDPALAGIVAIASDVAVGAAVEAAGGEVDGEHPREAGEGGWR